MDGLPAEHGTEEGIWINADPVPNCVVCNIGESMLWSFQALFRANVNHFQCGRYGQADYTKARYTEWFTEDRIIGRCCAVVGQAMSNPFE
jgi:hypothetical protein